MPCFCVGRQAVLGDEVTVVKGKKPVAAGLKGAKRGDEEPQQSEDLIGTAVSEPHSFDQVGPAVSEQPSEQQPSVPQSERQRGEGSAESAEPLLSGDGGGEAAGGDAGGGSGAGDQADPPEAAEQRGSQQEEQHSSAVGEASMPLDAAEPSGSLAAAAEPAMAEPEPGSLQGSPEGSQAALLSAADEASHISLKQPRLSRLSGLLSACASGRTGGDSGESFARQQQPATEQQYTPQVTQHLQPAQLNFEPAAAELVLLPRARLLPLAQPEQALADAAGMLGRHEVPVLLTALLTLRRAATHHPHLLDDSLEDVSQVLLECVQQSMHAGGDAALGQAACIALLDLFVSFGGAMLRHCEHPAGMPQYSTLLGLLLAASRGRTPAIRAWADEALRYMAERMQQSRVIRLLEPWLEYRDPHVRQKAAAWLLVATYRPPDNAATRRPASPSKGVR